MDLNDIDLYGKDKDFNADVKDCIAREIEKGQTPEGAALIAGVSVSKFHKWCEMSEVFRSWVSGEVVRRNSRLKGKLVGLLEGDSAISDKERADLLIKFLEREDATFGTKRVQTEVLDTKRVVSPLERSEVQEEIERHRLLREAEKHANGGDNV